MSVVTLRPDALDDFAVSIVAELVRVRTEGVDLDRTRAVYESRNPDYHASTAALMDEIMALIEDVDDVARRVARFAAAARELDRDYQMGPPGPGQMLGVAVVDAAALERQADSYLTRWQTTTDIREFMHAIPQEEWNQLVFGQPAAYSHLGGDYVGGGVIIGPDGLPYPIVIPEVHANGQIYRADGLGLDPEHSVLTLVGSDPGWTTSDILVGVTRVRDEMAPFLKAATFLGVATNPDIAPPSAGSPDDYAALAIHDNGQAWLVEDGVLADAVNPPPVPEDLDLRPESILIRDESGAIVRVDPSNPRNRHQRRELARLESAEATGWTSYGRTDSPPARTTETVVSGSVDLTVGLLTAARTVGTVDHSDHRAYQTVFQRNEDGRRRALVRWYGLSASVPGWLQLRAIALNSSGEVASLPLRFRPVVGPVLIDQPIGATAHGGSEG